MFQLLNELKCNLTELYNQQQDNLDFGLECTADKLSTQINQTLSEMFVLENSESCGVSDIKIKNKYLYSLSKCEILCPEDECNPTNPDISICSINTTDLDDPCDNPTLEILN